MSYKPTSNPWHPLRQYTSARIALGHTNGSLPTSALLRFQADHATARNAVHSTVHFDMIAKDIRTELNMSGTIVHSMARDRAEFLKRPDLGRRLDPLCKDTLTQINPSPDIVFIIGDGLSATAINLHILSLLKEIFNQLQINTPRTHHIVLAKEARVALGDEIGQLLRATISVMLIGERPGLSNAESIGAYITYSPKAGRTDAERCCISNICPIGLNFERAAIEIVLRINAALTHQLTGIQLGQLLCNGPLIVDKHV